MSSFIQTRSIFFLYFLVVWGLNERITSPETSNIIFKSCFREINIIKSNDIIPDNGYIFNFTAKSDNFVNQISIMVITTSHVFHLNISNNETDYSFQLKNLKSYDYVKVRRVGSCFNNSFLQLRNIVFVKSRSIVVTNSSISFTKSPLNMSLNEHVLCSIVSATDVSKKVTNWNCTNNIPVTPICSTWDGVICNKDSIVTDIRLSYYGLSGTLPTSLGLLSSLTFFQITGNSISGIIPTSLGLLTLLTDLWLGSNRLAGSIPTALCELTSLQVLSVNENSLTGKIPENIGELKCLRVLWLEVNHLIGPIPSGLDSLSALYTACLHTNSLTGSIPSTIGRLSKLMSFSIYYNSLSGSLPSGMGQIPTLTSFRLYGNRFTGSLPSALCGHSLVDFYPLSPVTRNGNEGLICYAPCLRSVAFHYFGSLSPCKSGNESDTGSKSDPTTTPMPTGASTNIPTISRPSPVPPVHDTGRTDNVIMMASFFFVIFDVAVMSMLVLECLGLGHMTH